MKSFYESRMCKDGRLCIVCRDLEYGRRWRELLVNRYDAGGTVEFTCPCEKPWITSNLGSAHYNSISIGGLAMEHVDTLAEMFKDHPILADIRKAITDADVKTGCTSCSRHKIKSEIGHKVNQLDNDMKLKVYNILGLV